MRFKLFHFITLAIVLLLVYVSLDQLTLAKIIEEEGSFSTAKALEHLKVITDEPHPSGTVQNAKVRDYIVSTIKSYGFTPVIQEATVQVKINGKKDFINIKNIIVKLEGSSETKPILVNCHYDSSPKSFGAGDDGISIAVMLEVLRVMSKPQNIKNSLVFLFNDGEEFYLKGAKAFEEEYPAESFSAVINLEGMNSGPSMLFDTSKGSSFLSSLYLKSSVNPVSYSVIDGMIDFVSMSYDLEVFDSVTPGIGLAPCANMLTYHQALDNFENMNPETVYHHGINTLKFVQAISNYNFSNTKSSGLIFFNVMKGIVVSYSDNFALITSIVILLIVLAFFLYVLIRRHIKAKEIILGFLTIFIVIVSCAFLGEFSGKLLSVSQEEFFNLPIANQTRMPFIYEYATPIMILIVLCMLAVAFFIMKALIKKLGKSVMQSSTLLLWTVILVLTLFFNIKFSYLFSWPVLFVCISMVLDRLDQSNKILKTVLNVVRLFFTLAPVIILFLPPLALLLSAFLGLNMMGLLGIIIGLCGAFVVPQLLFLKLDEK